MNERIDARTTEHNIDRPNDLAGLGEIDLDGIVHAAAAKCLEIAAVGSAGKNSERLSLC
jgi:hypothetical protein